MSALLLDKLTRIMVGGCTCMTKTDEVRFHAERCHYRLAFEASELLMPKGSEFVPVALTSGQNCSRCAHSTGFDLTPTGRFKRDAMGRCAYDIPMPVMPVCVQHWDNAPLNLRKKDIRPLDGETCPTYKPKT